MEIGTIAGIIIGSLVVLVLFINITCYFIKKRRLERLKKQEQLKKQTELKNQYPAAPQKQQTGIQVIRSPLHNLLQPGINEDTKKIEYDPSIQKNQLEANLEYIQSLKTLKRFTADRSTYETHLQHQNGLSSSQQIIITTPKPDH